MVPSGVGALLNLLFSDVSESEVAGSNPAAPTDEKVERGRMAIKPGGLDFCYLEIGTPIGLIDITRWTPFQPDGWSLNYKNRFLQKDDIFHDGFFKLFTS